MKLFIVCCFVLTANTYALAQFTTNQLENEMNGASEKKLIVMFNELTLNNSYFQALRVANELYDLDSNSANYQYRLGLCLLTLNKDFDKAKILMHKASKNVSKQYDLISVNEKKAPVDALFWLGYAYHIFGQIDSAKVSFKNFLSITPKKGSLVSLAKLHLCQLQNLEKALNDPKNVVLLNLGDSVNTIYPEYAQVVSYDASALFYTSRRPWVLNEIVNGNHEIKEDIYKSYLLNEEWTKGSRLDLCTVEQNESTVSVGYDERQFFIYSDITGYGDIYKMEVDTFSTVRSVPAKINFIGLNTDYWETHAVFNLDSSVLFFVSDRPGGFGGRDLYKVLRKSDGSWSKPENLGPQINSINDEDAPFVTKDSKMLYFSSNGDRSIGGYDVFCAKIDDNYNCYESTNLGYPLNSTGDDIYFTTTFNGSKAFVSSFRVNGKGDLDIYEVRFKDSSEIRLTDFNLKLVGVNDYLDLRKYKIVLECLSCPEQRRVPIENIMQNEDLTLKLVTGEDYIIKIKESLNDSLVYEEKIFASINNVSKSLSSLYYVKQKEVGKIVDNYRINLKIKDLSEATEIVCYIKNDGGNEFVSFDKSLENTFETNQSFDGVSMANILNNKLTIVRNSITSSHTIIIDSMSDNIIYTHVSLKNDVNKEVLAQLYQLKPIYFDYRKSDLTIQSIDELDKLIKVLVENPDLSINIIGHTDTRGKPEYNELLAFNRAVSVVNYLVSKGLSKDRLTIAGQGENSPVYKESFINSQVTKDKQEYYHMMNRRVEIFVK